MEQGREHLKAQLLLVMVKGPMNNKVARDRTGAELYDVRDAAKELLIEGLATFSDTSHAFLILTAKGQEHVKTITSGPLISGDAISEQGQGDSGDDRDDPVDPQV